ncbi:UPF0236 family transposase-like protein [Ligilactobacillus equi]|uniref:UPF0236 family transposase-like protein n=1 Tax=Ligilactobacillus equi TaxID=137357 RepID=UPI0009EC9AA6|nr:UPF0236 family protein [Ligilactobacillus equi]
MHYAGSGGKEDLWDNVKDYIVQRYGKDAFSKIKVYFTSDEGKWLKTCSNWLDVVEILDKFHVVKACRLAVGGGFKWNGENKLKKWVLSGDWDMVKPFKKVYLSDPTIRKKRRNTVTKSFNYLLRNSKQIDNIRDENYCGDSTEARISHWVAERDSSRPCVWSKEGLDSVMFFRCCLINKVDIYDKYCHLEYQKGKSHAFDKRVTRKGKMTDKYLDTTYKVVSEARSIQQIFDKIGDQK